MGNVRVARAAAAGCCGRERGGVCSLCKRRKSARRLDVVDLGLGEPGVPVCLDCQKEVHRQFASRVDEVREELAGLELPWERGWQPANDDVVGAEG